MAEESGERRVTAQVGAELISLMVPEVDPELRIPLVCAGRGMPSPQFPCAHAPAAVPSAHAVHSRTHRT